MVTSPADKVMHPASHVHIDSDAGMKRERERERERERRVSATTRL